MAITSLGFNVPGDDSIEIISYDVSIDGVSILDENSSKPSTSWSSSSTIDVSFELDVSLLKALQQSALPAEVNGPVARIGAVINWKSSRTGLHGSSEPTLLTDGVNEISTSLVGSKLGGDLTLRISVILLDNPLPHETPLAPTRYGSRLWENSVKVQLEGDGSQFPTSAFDFETANFSPTGAMWKIDIDPSLESHVSSAIRLKMNTGHPRIQEYLKDPTSKEQEELYKFLRTDTVVQLLTFALNCDLHQLELDAEQEGTLAETLDQIYKTYFPGLSIHSVRELYLSDPSFVTATVQSSIFNESRRKGK